MTRGGATRFKGGCERGAAGPTLLPVAEKDALILGLSARMDEAHALTAELLALPANYAA